MMTKNVKLAVVLLSLSLLTACGKKQESEKLDPKTVEERTQYYFKQSDDVVTKKLLWCGEHLNNRKNSEAIDCQAAANARIHGKPHGF